MPAALEYVRIVRLTGSGVASRLGFDIEEIENLRVALDELASMAIDAARPGELEITFFTTDTELRITGRAPVATGADVGVEALTAQILKAVIDDYELRAVRRPRLLLVRHPPAADLRWRSPAQERAASRAKFVEFRRTGDRKLRNELIEAHKSLASHLARRYANRGEPFDDLLQVAYLGMLKAVERFDPERNLEFSTYATVTVEGELKRHFRDKTWSVRVPRRPQELHLRLGNVINELSQRLARAPRVPEVAAELGVAEEEVLEAMEVGGAYRSSSLDTRPGESSEPTAIERRLGAEDRNFDIAEHRVLLDAVLADLSERERTIVELRFFQDKTQTEIAEEVGISQMHVSRLLARTLIQLRERLETLDA